MVTAVVTGPVFTFSVATTLATCRLATSASNCVSVRTNPRTHPRVPPLGANLSADHNSCFLRPPAPADGVQCQAAQFGPGFVVLLFLHENKRPSPYIHSVGLLAIFCPVRDRN